MLNLLRYYQSNLLKKVFKKVRYSDMQKHSYIVGKSGSGKSEILKSLFYLLERKTAKKRSASLILMDPHGDLAKEVIRFQAFSKNDRLIYIQPERAK